ncbi:dehydrase and lipid transport-domain-containing protein [Xylariales sp. PMI_506]|nr:dehydrase and lipid transport-domain-containing protein [Xylariales sp. PMI_506]
MAATRTGALRLAAPARGFVSQHIISPPAANASCGHRSSLQQHRTFFNLPSAPPQTLNARRRLPYAAAPLYEIIADVDSYPRFLPYCSHTRVTALSPPAPGDGRRWPARADLTAGWGGLSETYTSRVICVPDAGVVEAISGEARTEIPLADLQRWGLRDPGPLPEAAGGGGGVGVFKSLVTRWTVRPVAGRDGDWSEVDLSIKFQFANPLYGAVSSAVADKVAPLMVEAFVKEARRVLGEPGKRQD